MWEKKLEEYESLKKYNLTEGEMEFLQVHCKLANKACGAKNFYELSLDNFSIASVEDFQKQGYNAQQIGGFISSLEKKGIVMIEGRDDDCDLYWIEDDVVEELAKED